MKRLKTACLLAVCMTAWCAVQAQTPDGLGIGIIIGEPTGLSIKKWLGGDRAVDAGIAWSFSENDSLHLHADYLWHRFDILGTAGSANRVPLYFGLGGRVKLKEENDGRGRNDADALVGLRVPFGISYLFKEVPADVFAEIVPILDVAPDTDFEMNAAIGARLYF
ncbi:MAG: hypothetical protein AB7T27_04065 [Kiritimatiellia bacterium]